MKKWFHWWRIIGSYSVSHYVVDENGGVDAAVTLRDVLVYIDDAEVLRAKRVKCDFKYDSYGMYSIK